MFKEKRRSAHIVEIKAPRVRISSASEVNKFRCGGLFSARAAPEQPKTSHRPQRKGSSPVYHDKVFKGLKPTNFPEIRDESQTKSKPLTKSGSIKSNKSHSLYVFRSAMHLNKSNEGNNTLHLKRGSGSFGNKAIKKQVVMSSKGNIIVPFHERRKTESIDDTELSDRQPFLKSLEQIHHLIPSPAIITTQNHKTKGIKRKGILESKHKLQIKKMESSWELLQAELSQTNYFNNPVADSRTQVKPESFQQESTIQDTKTIP